MRLIPMQIQRHARDGELHHQESRKDITPETEAEDAVQIFH
jgi:hypothetical protein